MTRKIRLTFISIIIISLLLISYLLYSIYYKDNQNQNIETIIDDPFGIQNTDIKIDPNNNKENEEDILFEEENNNIKSENRLKQLSFEPISNYIIKEDPFNQDNKIWYSLRRNGNIYSIDPNSINTEIISITTIPKVYETIWLNSGNKLISRYIKEGTEQIESFLGEIKEVDYSNDSTGSLQGSLLTENIKSLISNPKGDKIFYLVDSSNGIIGYISKPNNSDKKIIFNSSVKEWNIAWPKEEIITLVNKPSSKVPGYLYFLNSQNGDFKRIIGNIKGLTAQISPDIQAILYSESNNESLNLNLYSEKEKESKIIPWKTLPEKCLWSKEDLEIIYCAVPKNIVDGEYPDIWYQGLINFNDDIWMINTKTGITNLIFDIENKTNKQIDAINLQLDEENDRLFFINKTDLTLWGLDLN